MSVNSKRTCVVCGRQYAYCRSCGDKQYAWKRFDCSPRCFAISQAVHSYFYDEISAEEAFEKLQTAGYHEVDILPSVMDVIKKIKAGATKKAAKQKPIDAVPDAKHEE